MPKTLQRFANVIFLSAASSLASTEAGAAVIDVLKKGNQLFVQGGRSGGATRNGVHFERPVAVVLASSDIPLPPEHLFGSKPGELIVIRNAGPVVDSMTLDSIRFYCRENDVKTVVLLASAGSRVTAFALEERSSDTLAAIKTPILASLGEMERHEGAVLKKLGDNERADAITKTYVSHLLADFAEAFKGKNVEFHGALVHPENGRLEWMSAVKRKSGGAFGQPQQSKSTLVDPSGL